MFPEHSYVNFLQSQYSSKKYNKFQSLSPIIFTGIGHMANSPTIKLVLSFSHYALMTLASGQEGPRGPAASPPTPKLGTLPLCFTTKWPQVCASVGPAQAGHRNGQGTMNRFSSKTLRPPQGIVGDGWAARRDMACHEVATLWGHGCSWFQSHQEVGQAWLKSMTTLVNSGTCKDRAKARWALEA